MSGFASQATGSRLQPDTNSSLIHKTNYTGDVLDQGGSLNYVHSKH